MNKPISDMQKPLPESEVLLRLEGVSKSFGGVRALRDVRLDLRAGEVHALMGENGAGKSTLIKILGGIYQADRADISISGQRHTIEGVKDSQKLGISIVHQELILVEGMTVAENMFLGKELKNRYGLIDHARMAREASKVISRFAVTIDPNAEVSSLSLAQKQIVEIAKALLNEARIIVMDEPTAALTQGEVEKLFEIVRQLKSHNCSVLYVSHRMEEIFALSDRITVFRDGQYISTVTTSKTTSDELIRLMVGRDLTDFYRSKQHDVGEDTALQVSNLSRAPLLRDISFALGKGEVLGFYGLIGAGRTELARVLFGIDRKTGGDIRVDGKDVTINSPTDAIGLGIALAPESRKEQGLVLEHSVAFNITLAILKRFQGALFLDKSQDGAAATDYIRRLGVKVSSPLQSASKLSGGNQQKVVLAKWLATEPKVLILDEPTRGIDIGAKTEIYQLIGQLAESGLSIIFISSDLPEVMHISDRICVMRNGTIAGIPAQADFSEELILSLASGVGND